MRENGIVKLSRATLNNSVIESPMVFSHAAMIIDEKNPSFEFECWQQVNKVVIAAKTVCVAARLIQVADTLMLNVIRRGEIARSTHVEGQKHLRIKWPTRVCVADDHRLVDGRKGYLLPGSVLIKFSLCLWLCL